MELEKLKKRIKIIKDLQEEARKLKETYSEMFGENAVVQEAQQKEEEFKNTMSEYAERIKAIKEQGTIKNIAEELKQIKTDIKENKEALAIELLGYYKEGNSLEITDEDGVTYFIKFDAKLKAEN